MFNTSDAKMHQPY